MNAAKILIASLALMVLSISAGAATKVVKKPVAPRYHYVVSETNEGGTACFFADQNGDAYGNAVEDRFCAVRYAVGESSNCTNLCFPVAADGNIFGSEAASRLCFNHYEVSDTSDGSRSCFMVDRHGTAYGYAVDPVHCQ